MWGYKISLFIHVISIASWFGGITLMAMYLRNAIRSNDEQTMTKALATAHRWNLTMMIPTSVLALLTGTYMLLQYGNNNQPLWLLVKERFGGLFIIAFILVVTLYGRKLLKTARETSSPDILKRYILILNLSVLCMVILIFFVTTKIS